MWLSVWPDINYNSVDINQSILWWKDKVEKPYVEVVKEWESEFDKSIWKIKSELGKEWKILELSKSIEEQEKEIYNIVWNITLQEAKEKWYFKGWINVKYIDKWVFGIQSKNTKNISLFVNKKWNELIVLSHRQDLFTEDNWEFYSTTMKAMKEAWYYVDFKNWKRDIYKILWEKKDWSFILVDTPVDIFSKEYYLAWKKIIKIDDTLLILFTLKHWWKRNKNSIDNYVGSWALTIKILLLLENKWLLETPDLFEYAIIKMWVKESDVFQAVKDKEITSMQALKIYKILPEKNKDLSNRRKKK